MRRGFRFRIYPNKQQEVLLRKSLGCVRFVWNHFLAKRQQLWTEKQESMNFYGMAKELTQMKKQPEFSWMKDVSVIALRYGMYGLEETYKKFFRGKCGFPNFKKKLGHNSMNLDTSAFSFKDGQLFIAKSKSPIKVVWHRQLPKDCEIRNIQISLTPSGKWYVSMNAEDPSIQPLPKSDNAVGIDLGITTFATTSNGEKITSPNLRGEYNKLKRLQRRMSKKVKGSNNRYKARLKVAKQYERITNIRKDFHHKLSRQLVNENQVICIEDLNVKGMLKNRKVSRAVSEQGWYQFRSYLQYKCDWYGRELRTINQWYPSSKTCGSCGTHNPKVVMGVEEWTCPHCGVHHDRDLNAANNILAVGMTVSACGGSVRPKSRKGTKATPKKQETGKSLVS